MRICLGFLLIALPAFGAELKIDPVTFAGARLAAMRDAFTATMGIRAEYGGPHANHATEMALASFPDGSYIEPMGALLRCTCTDAGVVERLCIKRSSN